LLVIITSSVNVPVNHPLKSLVKATVPPASGNVKVLVVAVVNPSTSNLAILVASELPITERFPSTNE